MKKVYCDRCGKEVEQNGNILLRKTWGRDTVEEYFDICDTCREAFFGWLNGAPAEQEKPRKVAVKPAKQESTQEIPTANPSKYFTKPAKKSAKEGKSQAYTIQQIAWLAGAPVTTARRHAEGICSTYGKDKNGRTIRHYHLTDDQLTALLERIKGRKQGQRTKI